MRAMEPGDFCCFPGAGDWCAAERPARPLRALIVEDSDDDYELLVRCLRRGGYEVTPERVQTPGAMRKALGSPWDIVFADWTLPSFSAIEALVLCKQCGVELPFVVLSGTAEQAMEEAALMAGAQAFLRKGALGGELLDLVARELEQARLRAEARI